MVKDWIIRAIEAAAITVALTAVCQELEKPASEREWHGKVGFIPYDFRLPTFSRFRDAFWNQESARVFTQQPWGIGWAINLHALVDKVFIVGESWLSEEDFLMPTPSLRKVLEDRPAAP